MADRHEAIQTKVIILFTEQKRGRLYKMVQGLAVPIGRKHPIDFGPLKGLKGFPDLMGFEYCYYYTAPVIGASKIKVPVFCTVEIKTRNDSLSKAQRRVMGMLVRFGVRCYVAKENKQDDGYTIKRYEPKN